MVVAGLILIGVGVALLLADWGDLSKRMPTQVVPRQLASVPLAVGVCLIAADLLCVIGAVDNTVRIGRSLARVVRAGRGCRRVCGTGGVRRGPG